jgi:N4-gp56 family major capsid protein
MAVSVGGVSALGHEPIPGSLTGTTLAGDHSDGTLWAGDTLSTDFAKVVTNLVKKELVDQLRHKAVFLQEAQFIPAKNVKGTKDFVYTVFKDLAAADDVAEGVPPESVALGLEVMSFYGAQKAKIVAISDLAELFSPFDQYSIAAEKVAWNIVDTMETAAGTLLQTTGLAAAAAQATVAENIIANRLVLAKALVPAFPDGFYRAFISPTDAAAVMADTSGLGFMEAYKYRDNMPLINGEIGRFRGIRFIETTRVSDGSTPIIGPEAFAWGDYQSVQVYRVAPGGDHADPLAQRGLVGWKGMFGSAKVEFATGDPGPAANPHLMRYTVANLTTVA